MLCKTFFDLLYYNTIIVIIIISVIIIIVMVIIIGYYSIPRNDFPTYLRSIPYAPVRIKREMVNK